MNISRKQKILLATIILIAAFFRFYGLNWDQGQHLHPDERFLTMTANDIKPPTSISQYFNPSRSPLNPSNAGVGFFVYGTFPLFLVKILAVFAGMDNYADLTILGRAVSALFDIGTVLLVYSIAKELNPKLNSKRSGNRNFGFWNLPILASFFYAISVLPVQLAHFFAVDTFLTFFITLSFYLLIKFIKFATNYNKLSRFAIVDYRFAIFLGVAFGLALASKISALLFFPIIVAGLLISIFSAHMLGFFRNSLRFLAVLGAFTVSAYIFFRLGNPYAFSTENFLNPNINPRFIQNLKTLQSWNRPQTAFPPGIQWIKTKPFVFPLRNMLYYGLGVPLGLLAIGGFVYVLVCLATYFRTQIIKIAKKLVGKKPAVKPPAQNKRYKRQAIAYQLYHLLLAILWTAGLFLYQGSQFVKNMRYFLPVYPFLAILAAILAAKLITAAKKTPLAAYIMLIFLVLLWPLAFLSIYSRPHSRVAASRWIYENIPSGATLTCEHWDDCLPLPLSQGVAFNLKKASPSNYNILQLPLYDPDTPEKWAKISKALAQADYIVLSSNRLYGSISSVPRRYPITSKFYQQLFTGQPLAMAHNLRFIKIAEFTSRPHFHLPFLNSQLSTLNFCISAPFEWYGKIAAKSETLQNKKARLLMPACKSSGITIIDDYADESFTVYDHPKVTIFWKIAPPRRAALQNPCRMSVCN